MYPVLCKLGPFTVYSYGVAMVAAFLAATWLATQAARRLPQGQAAIPPDQLPDVASVVILGGILGARALYVALHWDGFLAHPLELFAIWHGGLVFYGGVAGSVLAGWLYARAKGLSLLLIADQLIPFVALAHAIGRIGCFLNGCCYGWPTGAWYGVLFPGHDAPVIPTQLIEAAGLFGLFLALSRAQTAGRLAQRGALFGRYLAGYGLLRFVVEFLRGDQTRWLAGMTLQQVISIALLMAGTVLIFRSPQQQENKHRPR